MAPKGVSDVGPERAQVSFEIVDARVVDISVQIETMADGVVDGGLARVAHGEPTFLEGVIDLDAEPHGLTRVKTWKGRPCAAREETGERRVGGVSVVRMVGSSRLT